MKTWHVLLAVAALGPTARLGAVDASVLSAYERSQGWRLLFDGQSLSDWRGYHQNRIPENWSIKDGSLTSSGGMALVSADDFKDFEIQFDWKVSADGHGAVYFRADDDAASPAEAGPVMELAGKGIAMGGNGGIDKPWRKTTFQPDVWYRAKISVFGYQVDFWIDNERVSSFLMDTPAWRAAVAESRFKGVSDYGLLPDGSIILEGKGVSFRNIKIRSL